MESDEISQEIISYIYSNREELNAFRNEQPQNRKLIDNVLNLAFQELIGDGKVGKFELPGFKSLFFPFYSYGNVSSVDTVNFSELMLFSFYITFRDRYDYALDLGANIGLHSLMLSRAGFDSIVAFEPDLEYRERFNRNMAVNEVANIELQNIAISDTDGEATFVRLLGNTTGSHISGSKQSIYGETKDFKVKTISVENYIKANRRGLIKMDIEGSESKVIRSISPASWKSVDVFLEVGSEPNAREIFDFCKENSLTIFAERLNWSQVAQSNQMPTSWKDGSLLVTFDKNYFEKVR